MVRANHDSHLNVLLHELAEARDDDRYALSQFPVLITAALTLIAAMAALFATTYPDGYPSPDSRLLAVPIWVYIGAPMLPIVLIGYVVLISTLGTLRSYYQRDIERKIHDLTAQDRDRLPIPSWAHVQLEAMGQAHAGPLPRLNWFLVYGIIALLVLGGCVALASKIPVIRYRVFALVVNGALMLIPISAGALSAAGGARLWDDALAGLRGRLLRTDRNFRQPQQPDERSLVSFLFLPRYQEELLKALFIPICFLVGRFLALRTPRYGLAYCVGFFLVFEFVVYQARYLMNDVRDRRVDCRSKVPKRWRFPCSWLDGGEKEQIALGAALVSFLARLVIAGLLVACILPLENSVWVWHLGFLASIFLIALPYETARSRCIEAVERGSALATTWTVAVIGVVGLGYGLRSAVGLRLSGVDDKVALVLVAIGASLFGSTFIGLTWALESTQAGNKEDLAKKAHFVLLHDLVCQAASHSKVKVAVGPTGRVLAGRQCLMAPWCVSGILGTSALVAFALYLLPAHLSVSQSTFITMAVVVIAGVAVVTPVKVTYLLTGLNLVGVGVVLRCLSATIVQSVIGAAVASLCLVLTCILRAMCFEDLPGFTNKVIKILAAGIRSFYSWFTKER